jgi:hypothetical protein
MILRPFLSRTFAGGNEGSCLNMGSQAMHKLGSALILAVCGWIGLASSEAAAQSLGPAKTPILRIELGMHAAPIRDMALSDDASRVATVGDDKTLRIWSTETGTLLETVRAPMDDGADGILNTVAYWPGESHIVTSGVTGARYISKNGAPAAYVYFVSQSSGFDKINKVAYGGVVRKVAVFGEPSSKRRRLAVAHANNPGGVTVANERAQPILATDLGAPTTWVEFAPDGRLVATARNGLVVIWSADYTQRIEWRAPIGAPSTARISPDGRYVAIGYENAGHIDILTTKDLSVAGKVAARQTKPAPVLSAVAWDSHGGLWAGGNLLYAKQGERPRFAVKKWRDWRKADDAAIWPVADDAVTVLEAGPDGDMFFGSADPAWGRISGVDGKLKINPRAQKPDYRDADHRLLAVGGQGVEIAASLSPISDLAVKFNAEALRLERISALSAGAGLKTGTAPEGFERWRNRQDLQIGGRIVRLRRNDIVRSGVRLADSGALVGTDYTLIHIDASGRTVAQREIATPALALAVSQDQTRLIAAHGDGVLRWYDLTRPAAAIAEVAALYVDPDRLYWIVWTPDGYFAHSEQGGDQLAGFSINRGFGQTARWVSFRQLYRDRYRPDIVRRRLTSLSSASQEVKDAGGGKAAAARVPEVVLKKFCIVQASGELGECFDANQARRAIRRQQAGGVGGHASLQFNLPAGAAQIEVFYEVAIEPSRLSSVDVFRSDRSSGQTRAIRRRNDSGPVAGSRRLPLSVGENRLQVRAYTVDGVFGASPEIVVATTEAEAAPQSKLYVLAIGVNRYGGEGIPSLAFARRDAEAISQEISNRLPTSYLRTESMILLDEQASRDGILSALTDIAAQARPEDAVVVYIAGHGVVDEGTGRYYFVHSGVGSWREITEQGLADNDLVSALGTIPADNILLMLDTCHAGAFPVNTAASIANETGYFVLAASSTTEEALDGYSNRNGVFAHAFLAGVRGEAPSYNGVVDVLSLGGHVRRRVPELAQEKGFAQNAQFRVSGGNLREFPIAKVE